jgi:hypothetical protein
MHKRSPSETGNAEQHSVRLRRPTTQVQLQFVLKTLSKKKRFNKKDKSQALIRDGRRNVAVARAL